MFVEAYGAEAGNLALRTVSTGGVFIGGGIAPKILPALREPAGLHQRVPREAAARRHARGNAGEGHPQRGGRAARRRRFCRGQD